MGKISEIFNFENIGGKIKDLAKWSCWITILLIWIAAPIAFIVLVSDKWTAEFCWIPLVGAVVGPVFVWISSWAMYAFGEFVEDTHAMRKKYYPMAEEQANREAEERAKREAEAKAKHEAELKAQREATEKARQEAEEKAKEQSAVNTPDSIKKEPKPKEAPREILPCPQCGEDLSFMGWDDTELHATLTCPLCGKEILLKQ